MRSVRLPRCSFSRPLGRRPSFSGPQSHCDTPGWHPSPFASKRAGKVWRRVRAAPLSATSGPTLRKFRVASPLVAYGTQRLIPKQC